MNNLKMYNVQGITVNNYNNSVWILGDDILLSLVQFAWAYPRILLET